MLSSGPTTWRCAQARRHIERRWEQANGQEREAVRPRPRGSAVETQRSRSHAQTTEQPPPKQPLATTTIIAYDKVAKIVAAAAAATGFCAAEALQVRLVSFWQPQRDDVQSGGDGLTKFEVVFPQLKNLYEFKFQVEVRKQHENIVQQNQEQHFFNYKKINNFFFGCAFVSERQVTS